jgi:hypothetical protein
MEKKNFQIEIIKSIKRTEILTFEGYIYHNSYQSKHFISWRCKIRSCPGRIKIFSMGGYETIKHNHQKNQKDV